MQGSTAAGFKPQELTLQEKRDFIAQNRDLVRYKSTLQGVLNEAFTKSLGVSSGLAQEKSVFSTATDVASIGVSFVPVAGQIASAVLSGLSIAAEAGRAYKASEIADSITAINPGKSVTAFNELAETIALDATIANQSKILACDGNNKAESEFFDKFKEIFSSKKKAPDPRSIEIKALAASHGKEVLVNLCELGSEIIEENEQGGDRLGIELQEEKAKIIRTLLDSITTPSPDIIPTVRENSIKILKEVDLSPEQLREQRESEGSHFHG